MSFQILNQPYDANVAPGGTATFTYLVADPSGTLTYQWVTDNHRIALLSGFNPLPGAELDGMWPIMGATAASYTTPVLLAGDDYAGGDNGSQFQCQVLDVIVTTLHVANQTFQNKQFQNFSSRCAVLQVH